MEAIARLRNHPTSPTKMRLVADLVRGMTIEKALVELEFSTKHSSVPLRKLLLSAVSNWKQKNEDKEADNLFIKTIFVDNARVLKRMLPAPQGRAYRVRKRSNHVTIIVDERQETVIKKEEVPAKKEVKNTAPQKKTTTAKNEKEVKSKTISKKELKAKVNKETNTKKATEAKK